MFDIQKLISDVKAFAKNEGSTPEKVCRQATNNPRKFEQLERRAEQTRSDAEKIYGVIGTPSEDKGSSSELGPQGNGVSDD